MPDQQLTEELYKPIVRKFEKRKVNSPFIDTIWGPDLADMQLISKFSEGFRLLLCVTDIFSTYTRFIPLKDEKVLQLLMLFKKSYMNQIVAKLSPKDINQIKYGLIKAANFIIDQ